MTNISICICLLHIYLNLHQQPIEYMYSLLYICTYKLEHSDTDLVTNTYICVNCICTFVYTDSLLYICTYKLEHSDTDLVTIIYICVNYICTFIYTESLSYVCTYKLKHSDTDLVIHIYVYSLLHLECHSISFSNLNLLGRFSTERGKRDLENSIIDGDLRMKN